VCCQDRISHWHKELEVHISFLDGGEGRVLRRISADGCADGLEALVSDPILKPEDLQAFLERRDVIGSEVIVVIFGWKA
jgi:hypothetical protein